MRTVMLLMCLVLIGCGGQPAVAEADGLQYGVLWLATEPGSQMMEIQVTVENPHATQAVRFTPADVTPQAALATKLPFRLTDEHGNDYSDQHQRNLLAWPGSMLGPGQRAFFSLHTRIPAAVATQLTLELDSPVHSSKNKLRFVLPIKPAWDLEHGGIDPNNPTYPGRQTSTRVIYARSDAKTWIAAYNKQCQDARR